MRVKRGVTTRAKHNKIKKATKGMTLSNRSSIKRGKQAIVKALENAHRDRRERKASFRTLWITRINAAARLNEISYSKMIHAMTEKGIVVDRKILSEVAVKNPAVFKKVTDLLKG
jgi:large subunit ribosomal protein L20